MSNDLFRHPNPNDQPIPQVGIDPAVLASPLIGCTGGPCDGQEMRCPDGYILIITSAVDGLRATALPRTAGGVDMIALGKKVGGYDGHYEKRDGTLVWEDLSDVG
jgi:hypothetical protein